MYKRQGETVTIQASYSPFSASVDFGLVAPDGKFYYFNVTDGSIDETIEVDESGNYTLQDVYKRQTLTPLISRKSVISSQTPILRRLQKL